MKRQISLVLNIIGLLISMVSAVHALPGDSGPKLLTYPPECGRFIALPRLTDKEARTVIEGLALKFQAEKGYSRAATDIESRLPGLPEQVYSSLTLSRGTDKAINVLRFGLSRLSSESQMLLMFGAVLGPDSATVNPDSTLVEKNLDEILRTYKQSTQLSAAQLPVAQLEKRVIKLSYIDKAGALISLKAMGINVPYLDKDGPPVTPTPPLPGVVVPPRTLPAMPKTVSNDDLPMVVSMPGPDEDQIGLVGSELKPSAAAQPASQSAFGLSSVTSAANKLASDTVASPTSQIIVIFNPRHPEQFDMVKKTIEEVIDRPARQVYVEGMVLEISKDGLDELGVQWQFEQGFNTLILGSLTAGVLGNKTLDYTRDEENRVTASNLMVKVKALVRSGKAEILSRPSILTLDNRQATIRVGTDIPIATSKDASSTTDTGRVSFSFQYLPTGILLNLRPKISSDGKEVSILIDTTVSATVPGKDLQVLGQKGEVLASAPTIATRRVQTYARILNETPLIIGGLVNKDSNAVSDKVPLLGDLPFIGNLFRATSVETSKREVIIVLTPHVLSETQSITRTMPKDEDNFDSFGNELFRDSYRLRAEDVYDSRYIRTNKRLTTARALAEKAMKCMPALEKKEPFSTIAGKRVPGEQIFVLGMIYDLLKREEKGTDIPLSNMIFFDEKHNAEFNIQSVQHLLTKLGGGGDYRSFFENRKGEALAMSFISNRRHLNKDASFLDEPTPEINVVKCADRIEWAKILWDMNQPTPDGKERYSIVIANDDDLVRLSRVITLKRFISVNDGEENTTIRNYHIGRLVQFPEIKPDQKHLLDARVAKYYYYSKHHYPAFSSEMERYLNNLNGALNSQELSGCLKDDLEAQP